MEIENYLSNLIYVTINDDRNYSCRVQSCGGKLSIRLSIDHDSIGLHISIYYLDCFYRKHYLFDDKVYDKGKFIVYDIKIKKEQYNKEQRLINYSFYSYSYFSSSSYYSSSSSSSYRLLIPDIIFLKTY